MQARQLAGTLALFTTTWTGLGLAAGVTSAPPAPRRPAPKLESLVRPSSHIGFEPNRGQTDPRVRYLARRGNTRIFITDRGATMSLAHLTTGQDLRNRLGAFDASKVHIEEQSVEMKLTGGAVPLRVDAVEPTGATSSYFKGNDPARWIQQVPQYGRVIAREVYPGIDVAYYGSEGQLEYDFIVAPGANPGRIRLAFSGQTGMHLDRNGDLILETALGAFRHGRPKVYQEIGGVRVPVEAAYRLDASGVEFALGAYDRGRPLCIDPTLVSSTYFGGSNSEAITGMARTLYQNDVVVTGYTLSADFPHQAGASVPAGGGDAFLAFLNPDTGNYDVSMYLGGSKLDIGTTVDVDPNGTAVCMGGLTFSNDFPIIGNAFQTVFTSSNTQGFVTCFDASVQINHRLGTPTASTYIGKQDAAVNAVAFSPDRGISINTLFIAGYAQRGQFAIYGPPSDCESTNFCQPPGTDREAFAGIYYRRNIGSGDVAFVSAGGSKDDTFNAVDGGDTGIVAVGATQSSDVPVTANFNLKSSLTGNQNVLFCAWRFNLLRLFVSYAGGAATASESDSAVALRTRTSGEGFLYTIGGNTNAANWPVAVAAKYFRISSAGGQDGFLLNGGLNVTSGNVYQALSTLVGGSGDDYVNAVTSDSSGRIYATGSTTSTNLDVANPAANGAANHGGQDAFVLHFLPAIGNIASPDFLSYLGGSANDSGNAILYQNSSLYVAGTTASSNFPVMTSSGGPAFQSVNKGGGDGFIARYYVPDSSYIAIAPLDSLHSFISGTPITFIAIENCDAPSTVGGITDVRCSLIPSPGNMHVSVPNQYVDGQSFRNTFLRWEFPPPVPPNTDLDQYFTAVYDPNGLFVYPIFYREAPLTVAATAGGTASPLGSSYVQAGTYATISATPANGYSFAGWTGATPADQAAIVNPASAITSVLMNAPRSVTANFTTKVMPMITWATPAPIVFGSALSTTQLNATANVPGTFVYSPPAGTVPTVGSVNLTVIFTPQDTVTYSTAMAAVPLTVQPAAVGGMVVTRTLTRSGANVVVTVSLANTSAGSMTNVQLTTGTFGATNGTPLPQNLGTIPAGAVATTSLTLPTVTAGTTGVLTIGGTYTGGTFRSAARATLP